MGAVVEDDEDPVLVMELMDRGSLEDVLQYNASAVIDADTTASILKDVVTGMKCVRLFFFASFAVGSPVFGTSSLKTLSSPFPRCCVVPPRSYLHRASPPVLHLDLKPSNILVDSAMSAKVKQWIDVFLVFLFLVTFRTLPNSTFLFFPFFFLPPARGFWHDPGCRPRWHPSVHVP